MNIDKKCKFGKTKLTTLKQLLTKEHIKFTQKAWNRNDWNQWTISNVFILNPGHGNFEGNVYWS